MIKNLVIKNYLQFSTQIQNVLILHFNLANNMKFV